MSFLENQLRARVPIQGVLLGTPSRPTAQAAGDVQAASADVLEDLAGRLRALSLEVQVFG